MAKKIAFLFPGQGSQSVGMGKDLYENFDSAKNVFNTADKVLGKSITTISFEGPEDELKQTVNTQPSIVTMSIAALEALKSSVDVEACFVAGHSLGEYCAMYAAGVLTLEDTLKLIQKRADLMSETKGGAMAAVLNAPEGVVEKAISEALSVGYVDVANYNSPVQVVITGDTDAVSKASELIKEAGVRKVVPLAVSGAFHSKFMEKAGNEFAEFVSDFELSNATIPVVTNVDAEMTTSAEDFKVKMPKQIYSSVYWTQTIEKMISEGVDTFIEIGPGKVLAGLNKKIAAEASVFNVYDSASLASTVENLKEILCLKK